MGVVSIASLCWRVFVAQVVLLITKDCIHLYNQQCTVGDYPDELTFGIVSKPTVLSDHTSDDQEVGRQFDVMVSESSDDKMLWCSATLLGYNYERFFFHVNGWSMQAVRWFARDSDKVAPHGTHTNINGEERDCVEVGAQLSVDPVLIDDLIGECGKAIYELCKDNDLSGGNMNCLNWQSGSCTGADLQVGGDLMGYHSLFPTEPGYFPSNRSIGWSNFLNAQNTVAKGSSLFGILFNRVWRVKQDDSKSCPPPAKLAWWPGIFSYPLCSAQIRLLMDREDMMPHESTRRSRAARSPLDLLTATGYFKAQHLLSQPRSGTTLKSLLPPCPPPSDVRWLPDTTSFPLCSPWLFRRCSVPASGCHLGSLGGDDWGVATTRLSFYRHQEKAAQVGVCPSPTIVRWVPGERFYPECTGAVKWYCGGGGGVSGDRHTREEGVSLCMAWGRREGREAFWHHQWAASRDGKCPPPDLIPWGAPLDPYYEEP